MKTPWFGIVLGVVIVVLIAVLGLYLVAFINALFVLNTLAQQLNEVVRWIPFN